MPTLAHPAAPLSVLLAALLLLLAAPAASARTSPYVACVQEELGGTGAVPFLPNTREWNESVRIDNRRVAGERLPAVVVRPNSTDAVSAAVRAASSCGLPFSVLGGGHSAEGYGLVRGGLTLNMRSLNAVERLPRDRIRAGAGARWSEVYASVYPGEDDLVPVGGGCPQVGLGGFLLGGGWSFLSRSFGLGCDNVESMEVVLANGTQARLSAASEGAEADLWWASCGGGGGNFGVVTEFVLRARRTATPNMTVGELCWDDELSPRVRGLAVGWFANFSSMPAWMDAVPVWLPAGPGGARVFCFSVFCNRAEAECAERLAPLVAAGPSANTVEVQPYLRWQTKDNGNVTDAQGGYLDLVSLVVRQEDYRDEMVDRLMHALRVSPSPRNLVLFHVGGGAVAARAANATAFPHRDIMVVLQIKAIWDEPGEERANRAWLLEATANVTAFASGSYVNYISTDIGDDWGRAYYAGNLGRLERVKRSADPDNFFAFRQSVGADGEPQHRAGGNGYHIALVAFVCVVVLFGAIFAWSVRSQSRKGRRAREAEASAGGGYEALLEPPPR